MDVGTVVTTSIQSFFVVLGTALGYALAGINDSKKDKRALDRDAQARHAAYSADPVELSKRRRSSYPLIVNTPPPTGWPKVECERLGAL